MVSVETVTATTDPVLPSVCVELVAFTLSTGAIVADISFTINYAESHQCMLDYGLLLLLGNVSFQCCSCTHILLYCLYIISEQEGKTQLFVSRIDSNQQTRISV